MGELSSGGPGAGLGPGQPAAQVAGQPRRRGSAAEPSAALPNAPAESDGAPAATNDSSGGRPHRQQLGQPPTRSQRQPRPRPRGPPHPSPLSVLLWPPQLVLYARVALLVAAARVRAEQPMWALWLLAGSLALDWLDGWLARALGQTSRLGAVLDVLVDNATRGALYCWAFPGDALRGLGPCLVEMATLAATQRTASDVRAWREEAAAAAAAPAVVRAVMARGFKTPAGVAAIAGLSGLPLWCWAARALPGAPFSHPALGAALLLCRLLALSVELWVLGRCARGLMAADVAGPRGAPAAGAQQQQLQESGED